MSEWFYARGGQQSGPVSFEQLAALAQTGGLAPNDLVWTSTMKDWAPAGQVTGLFDKPAAGRSIVTPEVTATPVGPVVPAADPANPYAAPDSAFIPAAAVTVGEALEEIEPGSQAVDIGACVRRGFDLMVRHFGFLLLTGVVYLGVSLVAGRIFGVLDHMLGYHQAHQSWSQTGGPGQSFNYEFISWRAGSAPSQILAQLLSVYLMLGWTRIALNLVSGKAVSLGMLFTEGLRKFPRAVLASILYYAMVIVGLMLFIAPGVYLALRFGYFRNAIVDRDLGVMESLTYSSRITENNRGNLFLLLLITAAIFFLGFITCGIGLIVAIPLTKLAWTVAYRWLQYGSRAAQDHPNSATPMLSGNA